MNPKKVGGREQLAPPAAHCWDVRGIRWGGQGSGRQASSWGVWRETQRGAQCRLAPHCANPMGARPLLLRSACSRLQHWLVLPCKGGRQRGLRQVLQGGRDVLCPRKKVGHRLVTHCSCAQIYCDLLRIAGAHQHQGPVGGQDRQNRGSVQEVHAWGKLAERERAGCRGRSVGGQFGAQAERCCCSCCCSWLLLLPLLLQGQGSMHTHMHVRPPP